MAWTIEYDPGAILDLKKLDRSIRREIVEYMENRIASATDPHSFGKPLRGNKFGLWRYRVRDYRIVCELRDLRAVVLVVIVGRRRSVYEQ